jgi:hypothetical protein
MFACLRFGYVGVRPDYIKRGRSQLARRPRRADSSTLIGAMVPRSCAAILGV